MWERQLYGTEAERQNKLFWDNNCKTLPGPEVKKLFSMLNSTEHEIFPADKC